LINIEAKVDGAGVLCACRISGHAGAGKAGGDVVCAAVSVLARTFVRTAATRQFVKVKSQAPQRGELEFELSCDSDEQTLSYMRAISDLTLEGFRSVAEEYAAFCSLRVSAVSTTT
jgi:uncharacterized protein YsxB (DUF464 family)